MPSKAALELAKRISGAIATARWQRAVSLGMSNVWAKLIDENKRDLVEALDWALDNGAFVVRTDERDMAVAALARHRPEEGA